MENNINEYKFLFNNEEKRTLIIKEFEQNLNTYIQEIERKWTETKTIDKNSTKFNEYSQTVLQELQKLNDELRKMSELKKENFKKDVNILLNLEKENYKMTLGIYINKLNCFDLLKNDEDDYKLLQKEKEISTMKTNLSSIREEINDFITNLNKIYYFNFKNKNGK